MPGSRETVHRWLDERQLQEDLWAVRRRCDTWVGRVTAGVRVRVRVELVVGLARGEGEGEGEGPSTIYITICIYTAKAKGETKPLPQN